MRREWLARRWGKSVVNDQVRDHVREMGGKLKSDRTEHGVRTETFLLPDGRRFMFARAVSRGDKSE